MKIGRLGSFALALRGRRIFSSPREVRRSAMILRMHSRRALGREFLGEKGGMKYHS
jgi:hypothetical protein